MKRKITALAVLTLIPTLLLCASCSSPAEPGGEAAGQGSAEPIVLKFSDVNGEQSPAGVFCLTFKELVEERTEGRVIVENYFGGTLTANNIEGTQTGIADLSQHDVSEVTDLCPALSVLEAPYLFDSEEDRLPDFFTLPGQ